MSRLNSKLKIFNVKYSYGFFRSSEDSYSEIVNYKKVVTTAPERAISLIKYDINCYFPELVANTRIQVESVSEDNSGVYLDPRFYNPFLQFVFNFFKTRSC